MGEFRSRIGAFVAVSVLLAATLGTVDAQVRKKGQGAKRGQAGAQNVRRVASPLGASEIKKLGEAPLAADAVTVITKSKLAHQPKLLTSTGKSGGDPVDPKLKVSIAGGKQADADDLVEGTNGLEKTLNDLGYSLYTDENNTTKPIVSLRTKVLDLSVQTSDLRAMGGMKGKTMVSTSRNISTELVKFPTNKTPVIKTTVPGATVLKTPSAATTGKNTVKTDVTLSSGATGKTGTGGKNKAKGGNAAAQTSSKVQLGGTTATRATRGMSATITLPPPDFVTVDKTVTLFDKTYGDPDWFSIDFESSLTKKATMKLRKVTASADIKATLIGKSITIFHARAEAGGKKDYNAESLTIATGPRTAGGRLATGARGGGSGGSSTPSNESIRVLEATCLGDDLISPVDTSTVGRSRQVINGKSINWEYSVRIPIIPAVSAVGTIGARGSLKVTLLSDSSVMGGEIEITPSIDTSVYAEASISVGFFVASVEGGLGAELTLLDYDLEISAGVTAARTNINDVTYITATSPISATHSFETLSGRLYGFARISYWLPFKTREKTLWEGNLVNWNGFTDSRTLYSEDADAVVLGQSNIPMKEMKVGFGGGG